MTIAVRCFKDWVKIPVSLLAAKPIDWISGDGSNTYQKKHVWNIFRWDEPPFLHQFWRGTNWDQPHPMRAPRHGPVCQATQSVTGRMLRQEFPEFQWVLELVSRVSPFLRWWIVAVPSSSQVTSANDDDISWYDRDLMGPPSWPKSSRKWGYMCACEHIQMTQAYYIYIYICWTSCIDTNVDFTLLMCV
jgi:hypothetical protein